MTSLNAYYQCNGMQINNKKKLETSLQVKCKTTATRERGAKALEVEVSRKRTERWCWNPGLCC